MLEMQEHFPVHGCLIVLRAYVDGAPESGLFEIYFKQALMKVRKGVWRKYAALVVN